MTSINQIDNFAANAASIPGESASVRRATEGEASSTSIGAGVPGADAAPTAMASAMRWASTADRSHAVSRWRSLKHAMSARGRLVVYVNLKLQSVRESVVLQSAAFLVQAAPRDDGIFP